jgi:hypothetical protein
LWGKPWERLKRVGLREKSKPSYNFFDKLGIMGKGDKSTKPG